MNTLGTFTNTSGEKFKVRGISPLALEYLKTDLVDEWEKIHETKFPSRPTYTIVTVSGEKETYYHDEKTAETDEEKELLKEYTLAQKEIDSNYSAKLVKMCLMCVQVEEEKLKEWEQEQKYLKLPVPSDKLEKKARYIETRAVTSRLDTTRLISSIFKMTGITSEEDLLKAENSFRNQVEGTPITESDATER